MKGDFSRLSDERSENFAGVLHQQGRVLLDADWNAQTAITVGWQDTAGRDIIGAGVAAVPADDQGGFQIVSAVHAAGTSTVQLIVNPGRVWADGLAARLSDESDPLSTAAVTREATYLTPPIQDPSVDTTTIGTDVRDAVVLEAWREEFNAFQRPDLLIEPALGGPDTTERVDTAFAFRLMRLGDGDTCQNISDRLKDDFSKKGKLKLSLQLTVPGGTLECPTPASGGYTGFEHSFYRIEIAAVEPGPPQFKWSQYGGGLVGRGRFDAATKTVTIKANLQAITNCGLSAFYLEALERDSALGHWQVTYGAPATLNGDVLNLGTPVFRTIPTSPDPEATMFFRLWNGIERVRDFANSELPDKLGIMLAFDAPSGSNYLPGDYWTFPVRVGQVEPDTLIDTEPPRGIHYHRVPLAVLTWKDARDVQPIEDCRKRFRPLTNQKICCTFNVGDGKTSFGDFNSIELALRHLPTAGGEICLLPGLHTTNAVIEKRVNVTIRGCGVRTRVVPREKTLTAPIFTVRDSTQIEIEYIDLVTLGGTAILVEGSQPGLCDAISITRHRFIACTNAVLARNASHLTIAHNHIRMLDKADGMAALDIAADDVLIERNDIALVPAEHTPPVDPSNPGDPINPVDPCARLERVYLKPLVFATYVNQLWALTLPLLSLLALAKPYRALGGIQIRGGSERVRILENRIVGGGGNGITLGNATTVVTPPAPPAPRFTVPEPDANVHGQVIGPDGKPLAGVQITLTHLPDGAQRTATSTAPNGDFSLSVRNGTYEVSEGAVGLEIDKFEATHGDARANYELRFVLKQSEAPSADDTGFLYDVAIERNHIAAMGLSGIGVPGIPAGRETGVERALSILGAPVIGLAICDNRIVYNLRNPFDDALRAQAAARGLGGVSLGLADDVAITDNRIEGNGVSGADAACGIFIQYGESVEIARNVILDNGPVPAAADAAIRDGERGGIVLGLAANFGLFALLRGRAGDSGAAASAARILANQVEQPVGCALLARAYGPVMIDDNVFASQRSSVGGLDALAGTVLVVNLAGVQARAPSVQMKASFSATASAARAPSASTQPVGNLAPAGARAQPVASVDRPVPPSGIAHFAAPLLPFGSVLFNDNQTRAGAAHTSPLTQLLIAYDDVGFASNQCYTDQESNVFSNTVVLGTSLRATGNRLRERYAETLLSLLTISSRANNTTFNQGDHCIIAQDTDPAPPATTQLGNQVLFPSHNCPSFNMTTALLFKPLG
jgi:hypothetical protein